MCLIIRQLQSINFLDVLHQLFKALGTSAAVLGCYVTCSGYAFNNFESSFVDFRAVAFRENTKSKYLESAGRQKTSSCLNWGAINLSTVLIL